MCPKCSILQRNETIIEKSALLHLLVSSLISFTSVLYFSIYRSLVSLGRYSPKYFILSVAMVNGIVSLISLSVFSLLVYRNARDFWVLILYPASPDSMHDTGCLGLVHWDDPEGWYGEGGGRRVQGE